MLGFKVALFSTLAALLLGSVSLLTELNCSEGTGRVNTLLEEDFDSSGSPANVSVGFASPSLAADDVSSGTSTGSTGIDFNCQCPLFLFFCSGHFSFSHMACSVLRHNRQQCTIPQDPSQGGLIFLLKLKQIRRPSGICW